MKDKINLYEKKREKEIEEEINFLKELLETESYALDAKIEIRISELNKLLKIRN